jgi:dTMP kinase
LATRGKFITFEGPEGGGKTTQATHLIRHLEAEGIHIVRTREPGGTPTGEAIRDILQHDKGGETLCLETEALLFAASRAQLVHRLILPALERGDWVICDRFADSTTAYQGYGRGFEVADLMAINHFAINGAQPALTVLLDLDVDAGLARLARRQAETGTTADRIEREERAFHERVRAGYLELAAKFDRFAVIDAGRDESVIEQEIWSLVEPLLHRPS